MISIRTVVCSRNPLLEVARTLMSPPPRQVQQLDSPFGGRVSRLGRCAFQSLVSGRVEAKEKKGKSASAATQPGRTVEQLLAMSKCPACRAVSSIMCNTTQRTFGGSSRPCLAQRRSRQGVAASTASDCAHWSR